MFVKVPVKGFTLYLPAVSSVDNLKMLGLIWIQIILHNDVMIPECILWKKLILIKKNQQMTKNASI